MKQILQDLKTGATMVADVPCPRVGAGQVLIRTHASLVSAGTERMLVEFGKAGFLEKARQQPDKVRMVLDKIRTDGLLPTIETVRNKLDQPLPMGYCNVGVVMKAGSGVEGFAAGERVASNGRHAEVVSVPVNLCARVPLGVSDEDASFTVVGASALQGIRLAQPPLGAAGVDHADVSDQHSTVFHGDAANFPKQLLGVRNVDDRLIGLGQHRVHPGEALHSTLRLLALGDVARDRDNDVSRPETDCAAAGLHLETRPVPAPVPAFDRGFAKIAFDETVVGLAQLLPRLGKKLTGAHGDQLFVAVAERPARRIVGIDIVNPDRIDE